MSLTYWLQFKNKTELDLCIAALERHLEQEFHLELLV